MGKIKDFITFGLIALLIKPTPIFAGDGPMCGIDVNWLEISLSLLLLFIVSTFILLFTRQSNYVLRLVIVLAVILGSFIFFVQAGESLFSEIEQLYYWFSNGCWRM